MPKFKSPHFRKKKIRCRVRVKKSKASWSLKWLHRKKSSKVNSCRRRTEKPKTCRRKPSLAVKLMVSRTSSLKLRRPGSNLKSKSSLFSSITDKWRTLRFRSIRWKKCEQLWTKSKKHSTLKKSDRSKTKSLSERNKAIGRLWTRSVKTSSSPNCKVR